MPAAWMHRECASFGYWSKTYAVLSSADQKSVATYFSYPDGKRIDPVILADWLRAVSILRNRCAHHTRITYRAFPFAPNVPKNNPCSAVFIGRQDDLRTLLLVLTIVLKRAEPQSMWRNYLRLLLEKSSGVSIEEATGIGAAVGGWQNDPIWSI
jgi:abortive infection bacteriophage resistance protein